ncbi:MAG: response regulator [Candidatus Nealsonbacteria bacterium]
MSKNVLLVEDEEAILEILRMELTEAGYEVSIARDGEEGLKLMKERNFDIILLDIIMPKKDGFEVMEEKQKDPKIKDIPLIIVSNSGQPVELNRAQELGAKDWLIKTEFDPKEIVEKVRKQIG